MIGFSVALTLGNSVLAARDAAGGGVDNLLMEDGANLLLEDGTSVLLKE